MKIARPLTKDGLVGFDEHRQLVCQVTEGDSTSFFFIADVRGKTCRICGHGWEETGPGMRNQVMWNLVNEHVHETCLNRFYGLLERVDVQSAIVGAKIAFTGLKEIPNRYWPSAYGEAAKPWYEAELIHHPAKLVIGRRKRVWSISVEPQGGTKLEWAAAAEEAFKPEDVTKEFSEDEVLVHAWGTEKLNAYVYEIGKIAGYSRGTP